jgi:hypothetical protein
MSAAGEEALIPARRRDMVEVYDWTQPTCAPWPQVAQKRNNSLLTSWLLSNLSMRSCYWGQGMRTKCSIGRRYLSSLRIDRRDFYRALYRICRTLSAVQ